MTSIQDVTFREIRIKVEKENHVVKIPEKVYQILIGLENECYCYLDKQANFLEVSKEYCDLLGYTREELLNMGVTNVEVNADPEQITFRMNKTLKNGFSRFETQHQTKDGKVVDVEVSAIYTDHNYFGFLVSINDITEKKQSRRELQKEKEKFRALFENIVEYCYMISPDGTIIDLNNSALNILGYDKNELIGQPISMIYAPESHTHMKKVFEKWKNTGYVNNEEMIIITRSGERRNILLSASQLVSDQGNVLHSISIQKDITEKKKWEKGLEEERVKRCLFFESSLDGIVVLDEEGKVYDANEQFGNMLGYSLEEVKKLHIWDWNTIFTREQLIELLKNVHDHSYLFETIHRCKNGTCINVEISSNVFYENEKKLILCICRDFSERIKAEKELYESELKYRSLFDQSVDGIYLHDHKGNILDANNGAVTQSGYSKEELMQMILFDFIVDELDPDEIMKQWSQWKPGQTVTIETNHKHKDGHIYPVEISTSCVKYGSENYIMAMVKDISERKKAEIELRENEGLLRLLIEHAPVALAMFDRNMRYIAASNRWLTDYYLGDIDIIGKCHYDIFPEIPEEWKEMHRKTLKGEVCPVKETRLERVDGRIQWVKGEVRPWRTADGAVGGIVLLSEDITESKKVKEVLEESEKIFKSFFEQSSVGVVQVTPYGDYLQVNKRFCDMVGYSSDELVGMNFRVITHPDDLKLNNRFILQTISGEIDSYELEKRLVHKNGDIIWIRLYSKTIRDEKNSPQYNISVITDITEQKKVTNELVKRKRQLSLAMEASEYGFWELDIDTNKVHMSPTLYEINGYKPDKLPSDLNLLLDHIHPDDKDKLMTTIKRSILDITPMSIEYRIKHSSGEWRWMSSKGRPVDLDEKGVPHSFVGTQMDITSRVDAEKTLLYARLLADEYNCMKSDMLKNITHELRTPLTAIIGFSDVLISSEQNEFTDTCRKYVEYINTSGKDLLQIINCMLDFTIVENSDPDTLAIKTFEVEGLISEVLRLNYTKAMKKNIALQSIIEDSSLTLAADKEKLKHALYNLVDNAIKFTEYSGSVKIEVKTLSNNIQFSVHDTGIGIAEEKHETIFKPFVQIDGSLSRKYSGTGLGLALAKKIIELHDGTIKVESELGKGAKFIVQIPLNIVYD
ncbi:PAS domain S-box protein [Methanolobus sediminis]|uniref:histidine kinase n=1 Tax=Methanolobus sediminis TaxID=3072978 RepID=A0AA51YJE3_9EURY|nr:PAS domain S-box protein [Methanolobus sediminis]WMW25480.1 PAS domain S-box protein [Methanolobus sediminis]